MHPLRYLLLLALTTTGALAQPGTLDSTFGTGGVTLFPAVEANAVAFQADGKIVASGNVGGDAAVWRFLSDGALDPSFGTGGVATVDLGGPFDYFIDLAVLPSGAIVAVGSEFLSSGVSGDDAVVARFLSGGSLEAEFGTAGLVREPGTEGTPDAFWTVDVRPDGRIVAGGLRGDFNGPTVDACYAVQYLSDGTRDAAFGTNGVTAIAPPGLDAHCEDGELFPDGRYALAGRVEPAGGWAAMRLLEDGLPDPAFDGDGIALTTGVAGFTQAMVAGPDGSVTIVGHSTSLVVTLARFTPAGLPDPAFGADGVSRLTQIGEARVFGSVRQSDGKILFTGDARPAGTVLLLLGRVLPDGSLDPSFGTEGFTRVDVGQTNPPGVNGDLGFGLGLQPDGRIVVAGIADILTSQSGFVARFENDKTVANEPPAEAERLTLESPAPNPVLGQARIAFTLLEPAAVRLAVYDVLGREVAVLVHEARGAGTHEATFDASRLSPGVYVARLTAGHEAVTRRLVVAR